MNFPDKLDECSEFSHIFDLVKEAVKTTINRRRSGLMLGLRSTSLYRGITSDRFELYHNE